MIKNQVHLIIQKELRVLIKQSIGDVVKGIARQEYQNIVNNQVSNKISTQLQGINFQNVLTDMIKKDISSRMTVIRNIYWSDDQFNAYMGRILRQILKEKLNK